MSTSISEIEEEPPSVRHLKGDYQIAICQDGKFAVTFDTVNLQIKVLKNTDYRPFKFKDDKDSSRVSNGSENINKTITHFEINCDFTINRFCEPDANTNVTGESALTLPTPQGGPGDDNNNGFRWSLAISNLRERNNKYFILVAVSCINIDEDMRGTKEGENENSKAKGNYVKGYLKKGKYGINSTNTTVLVDIAKSKMRKGISIYCLKLEGKTKDSEEMVSEEEQKEKPKEKSEEKGKSKEKSEEEKEKPKEKLKEQKKETKDVDFFYSDNVSGICKFVDVDKSENNVDEQERFIILNFHGIYNFEFNCLNNFDSFAPKDISFNLNEKFYYSKSIRRELDNDTRDEDTKSDYMRRLLPCIYGKHFLVTQYKNDVQSLEVYNLAKMELETIAKEFKNKDEFLKQHGYQNFSVNKLQFCFTRGTDRILENGLQVIQKRFKIKSICSLEFFDSDRKLLIICKDLKEESKFIIWDLYHTDKTIILDDFYKFSDIENIDTRLARTSGNILYVDDKGNVTSVLEKIENKLKELEQEMEPKLDRIAKCIECNNDKHDNNGHCKYNIYYDGIIPNFDKDRKDIISNFNKIASDIEPWVLDDCKKNSFCLYYNKKGTKTEVLQLIVGRSTIQIWHQVQNDNKKKDELPNKGEPFLEYIWTNGIPVDQESEETKLQVEEFKYGSNDEYDGSNYKLNNFNFSLKVYWYEENKEIVEENKEIVKENKEIVKENKEIVKENKGIVKENKEIVKENKEIAKENKEIVEENEEIVEGNKEIVEENEEIIVEESEEIVKENKEMDEIKGTIKYVRKKTIVIEWKDIIETFRPIKCACKALKHFNKRYVKKCLAYNYNKIHKYKVIVTYIEHIVWRFSKHNPEQFKLLDIRYDFMKNLILGDCDNLIKFILFGEDENIVNKNVNSKEKEKDKIQKEAEIRHIPRNRLWPGRAFIKGDDLDFYMKDGTDSSLISNANDMELAIYHCKDRELKDTIIIAYLLEYYSGHAMDSAGWMCTVSKALHLLFKYNYVNYIRKLFHKECFANRDHFSAKDPDEIIPEEYLERSNYYSTNIKTFRPTVKLVSDQQEWKDIIFKPFKDFKNMIFKRIGNFDNDLGKSSLALRVVPLPDFTINRISKEKEEYNTRKIIRNLLLFIFIPRWYQIRQHELDKLSYFSRMVLYENDNDDIYDNPAIEAVIDFRWKKARNSFFILFIRFFIYSIFFVIVSWEYLNHNNTNSNSMFALVSIFYYLALYQCVSITLRILHFGIDSIYFNEFIFNLVNIITMVLPIATITAAILISRSQLAPYASYYETVLAAYISFSTFFFWMKLMFDLRLIPRIGFYIYYSVIIFKTILPFFFFMIITIIAFAHSMFILLGNPVNIYINTKDQTLSGSATSILTNEIFKIQLKSDFNSTSRVDNPFSSIPDALIAAYNWINGNWIQRNDFDFWAVDLYTVIISTFLVIFIQNLLISYMGGMHEKADIEARQRFLRHRARYVADYETSYHTYFWPDEPEPKYICYIGQSENFEKWYKITKDEQGAIYKDLEEKSTFTKRIFNESSYDKVSILVYGKTEIETKIETEIEKIKNMKNDINIDHLIENFKDKKNEIEHIKHIKNTIYNNVEYLESLIKKLDENNNEKIVEES